MAISTDDLKTLVGLLTPVIKAELESGSTGVGSLEAVSSLEGVFSLPALRKRGEEITAIEAPVSLLKGERGDTGDKGDDLEYRLLDSFPTLDALKAAYPAGTPEPGFFIAGDGMYVWNPKEGAFKEIRLEVDKVFTSEVFSEVLPSGDQISIDFSRTPYAKVTLGQDHLIYGLDIRNTREGSCGKVMVYQTGLRQLAMGGRLRGTIDLPLNADTIAILSYNRVGEHVYVHTATVIGDTSFPGPQRVRDFLVTYSDRSSCTVQWTAPWANNIYDRGTEYDMRYANSLADADDPRVWAGMGKVTGMPVPDTPGRLQRMTVTGLAPDKEYHVYLKTIRVNHGVEYLSAASDPAYFRTTGSADMTRAYRIDLTARNLVPQLSGYLTDTDGTPCSIDRMVDERESDVFLEDGYPDTANRDHVTFWAQYPYGRDTSPFDVIIDLFSPYVMDRMFVYTSTRANLSVYAMRDTGYPWERAGGIRVTYNGWDSLDLRSTPCRFIRLSFDLMDFGDKSTSPPMPEGTEGFPDPEYNGTLERINNLILYGRPVSTRPEGIMPPLRRSTARKTVDQFLCTNGHAYQQGRIHSMCSGERARMYLDFGHFAAFDGDGRLVPYERLADMRFRVSDIPWVMANNGTGASMEDNLRDTYKRFGLKPFLCNTGVFDHCIYDRSVSPHNRPCDAYWYPGAWRPAPRRGVGGLDRYHGVTTDAGSYKTYARLCHALSARYGNIPVDGSGLFFPADGPTVTGLDLVSGIEPENEPDQNWSGWIGYERAEEYAAVISAASDGHAGMTEEYAAVISAASDGHAGTLSDEDGKGLGGCKGGGLLSIASGTASVNPGYLLPAILRWRATRRDGSIPVDAFSTHMYFSNVGSQGYSDKAIQRGITLEEALGGHVGGELPKVCELRDRACPDKEIWLTEFGWGESGARDTASQYQCYSQPGRRVGGWLIPDRHRSDVKGAWIVRACVQMMAMGVDMANYYSTECEGDYFDSGRWGSGAGNEMFHWEDCADMTPGARVEAIKAYECEFPRGGFATTGLFGQLLGNGAYPVTRAYWWVATFRNRLKGFVYTGMRYLADERVVVACLKERDGDRGAYLVYYNDSRNTGVEGVEIPLPPGISSYTRVTVRVPGIPDPGTVPNALGWDRGRTGLPTSRKERYEGGKWVLLNKPYYRDRYMSYTKAPASYPATPSEGDEVTTLPTAGENPYFPIVGPVSARRSPHGNTLSAQQYERDREDWQDGPEVDADGNVVWVVRTDPAYAWRQVDAVCDYIEYHPDGVRGSQGDEVTESAIRGMIRANVSEFPEFYLFDAVPEPDYRGSVTDLSSRTVSSSAIELWWNNTSVEDTGYEILVSGLPETGYALLKTVGVDVENKALLPGLRPDTTYYYKVRPVRGDKAGTLSGHVAARTHRDMLPPTGLRVEGRTATSVRLAWDYQAGQVADFMGYSIHRADGTGAYVQAGRVDDQSIHAYEDKGLAVGRAYTYKARVVGLNGTSPYTGTVETRTLLPEEVSPALRSAITDKLGGKVTLTFDLPLGIVPPGARSGFTLTEDGNPRLVLAASRDGANPNNLVLAIPRDSLADHDRKTDIRVSYDGKGGILSGYGVSLEGFPAVRVANVIGNFTNINAIYQVNLCGAGAEPTPGWNDLAATADGKEAYVHALEDTYGRISGLSVKGAMDGDTLKWGDVVESGYCEIPGVPEAVYRPQWNVGHGNSVSESVRSRLVFTGLDDECRYTVKAYGATRYGSPVLARMRVGGTYTADLAELGNKTGMMVIEDLTPSNGTLDVGFINPVEGISTDYSVVGFVILEEYGSSDAPENTDVWLREVTVLEDDGNGVVKSRDVTVHLNHVGKATAYRIGEAEGLAGVGWTALADGVTDVSYTLSDGFGGKTVYAQVMNPYNESNVRAVGLEYRDPYVPLVLRGVYINNDDDVTYARDVTVLADREGVPTHYRLSESPDLSLAAWLAWPGTAEVPYRLTDGGGRKTVYMQVRDATTESAVRVDTIGYVDGADILVSISINGGAASTVDGNLSIGFVVTGEPDMMMVSESPDLAGTLWVRFQNPVTFPVSGPGHKTVYARVRTADALVSEVRSASIELVDIPPVTGRRLAVSLGWDETGYDTALGVNRIKLYPLDTRVPTRWTDGAPCGTLVNRSATSAGYGDGKRGAITGDDSFDYPDTYMERNAYVYKWDNVGRMDIGLSVPAGGYRVRLFNSTVAVSNGTPPYYRYHVITAGYGTPGETVVEIPQPSGYAAHGNTSAWIEADIVTAGEFHVRAETVATGSDVTVPINIIEVITR